MKLANNKILITGGASGIGFGLTERFIQENNTVIICGRREDRLQKVKEKFPTVITKVCDLSIEAERIELYNWICSPKLESYNRVPIPKKDTIIQFINRNNKK
jgi:uncharacterized oxidoreductase